MMARLSELKNKLRNRIANIVGEKKKDLIER